MKKRDMVLILILLIVSAAGLVPVYKDRSAGDAYIYVNGSLYGQYDLSDDTDIHITGNEGIVNDIEISEGSIHMRSATCPDKLCVKCGRISRNNESICCAPAGILIIIRSDKGEFDAVTK